jgi:hypothetical protein
MRNFVAGISTDSWSGIHLANVTRLETFMKTPKGSLLTVLAILIAACFAIPTISSASVINITTNSTSTALVGDIPFMDLPNNNPDSNFDALVSDVARYETFSGSDLPDPVFAGFGDFAPGTVSLTGFDYAVLHYGAGRGGSPGGGIVFYYLNGMTGNFDFPNDGLGPNGFGGLSSIRLFVGDSTSVPEGGATLMLIGIGLVGIVLLRRLVPA